jgi:SAM-dependent methyltransferase
MPKDLFSEQSEAYSKYRPGYPAELFEYILSFVNERKLAWDCATGNGQAATILANYFDKVFATDISTAQLENAKRKPNISYIKASAEQSFLEANAFDLITVAQAYHWFNWIKFYHEATRVGKPDAVVAVWTYNLIRSNDNAINTIIDHFYHDITGPYWDNARRHVEEGYDNIPFEFAPLPSKTFNIQLEYNRENLLGYLYTWSGVQAYIKQKKESPIPLISKELSRIWGPGETRVFNFPLNLKIGRIIK